MDLSVLGGGMDDQRARLHSDLLRRLVADVLPAHSPSDEFPDRRAVAHPWPVSLRATMLSRVHRSDPDITVSFSSVPKDLVTEFS